MNAVTTHTFNAGRAGSGAMQTFAFEPVGMSVRVILRDGAPWFIAADVAKAMGYSNPSKALRDHVAPDDRSNVSLDRSAFNLNTLPKRAANRGNPNLSLVNESGLYALILRSKKAEAQAFQHWVTSTVLPGINRRGGYVVGEELLSPEQRDALHAKYRTELLAMVRRVEDDTWHHSLRSASVKAEREARVLELRGAGRHPLAPCQACPCGRR